MLHLLDKLGGITLTIIKHKGSMTSLHTLKVLMQLSNTIFLLGINFLEANWFTKKLERVLLRRDCGQLYSSNVVTSDAITCSDLAYNLVHIEPPHLPIRGTKFKYQYS